MQGDEEEIQRDQEGLNNKCNTDLAPVPGSMLPYACAFCTCAFVKQMTAIIKEGCMRAGYDATLYTFVMQREVGL